MLEHIITWLNTVSQGNQMIAGAMALAMSGTVGFLATKLPMMVINFIKVQFITSMTLNNTEYEKNITFYKVSNFIKSFTTEMGSRTLYLDTIWMDGKNSLALTIGYGKHFFFYRKKFMWMVRDKIESSGSENQKEEITIYTFGRKHDIFHKFLEDNLPEEDKNKITISEYDGGWETRSKIYKKGLDKLALNTDLKESFREEIEYFKTNKEVYLNLGLPYKMSWIFHGEPGNGKTSLIRALASDFDMNICLLSLSEMTDKSLRAAINSAPSNSIIAIEDFDGSFAVKKRKSNPEAEESLFDALEAPLTLSGVLNVLDGIVSLDGNIIILTTNHIENIDPAILREGRIDKKIELPKIDSESVKEYFEGIYGKLDIKKFPSLCAKEINNIIFNAKESRDKVTRLLEEKCHTG